jgi:two-component system alkaline phosphatase synthesis response regulator PhoP
MEIMDKRILLVEDEEHLQDVIKMNLELEGYVVKVAGDGKEAIDLFNSQRFNLIILDWMLPNVDGITVCETIRLSNDEVPILFLSAKGTSADKITGLKSGADDYLVKPFNLEELLLRIQLLIKRGEKHKISIDVQSYHFGNNEINFKTFDFKGVNGQSGTLSEREAKLLKLLIDKKNQVVSRDVILELVWGIDVYPSTRTIDNYLLNFRKYFEINPKDSQFFHSIRGVGYKFKH